MTWHTLNFNSRSATEYMHVWAILYLKICPCDTFSCDILFLSVKMKASFYKLLDQYVPICQILYCECIFLASCGCNLLKKIHYISLAATAIKKAQARVSRASCWWRAPNPPYTIVYAGLFGRHCKSALRAVPHVLATIELVVITSFPCD